MERLEHQKKVSAKALLEAHSTIEQAFRSNPKVSKRIALNVASIGLVTVDEIALYAVTKAICKIADPIKADHLALRLKGISDATRSGKHLILAAGILQELHDNFAEAAIRIANLAQHTECVTGPAQPQARQELFKSMALLGPSMLR